MHLSMACNDSKGKYLDLREDMYSVLKERCGICDQFAQNMAVDDIPHPLNQVVNMIADKQAETEYTDNEAENRE